MINTNRNESKPNYNPINHGFIQSITQSEKVSMFVSYQILKALGCLGLTWSNSFHDAGHGSYIVVPFYVYGLIVPNTLLIILGCRDLIVHSSFINTCVITSLIVEPKFGSLA